MRSKFLTLNRRDLFQGIVVAAIISILTSLQQMIPLLISGSAFTWGNVKTIALVALGGIISYLLKNLFRNSDGNFESEPLKLPDV